MRSVLLRGAAQARNHLSRFLAERSADFLDGTTPHNHDVFLEPKHIDRTSVDGGEKRQQPIRPFCGDGVKLYRFL